MLNSSMSVQILKETFSIENVSFLSWEEAHVFISIHEKDKQCRVIYDRKGQYKCLAVNTEYDPEISWILLKISTLFSESDISIFAFTSIDYWYFFFEEKFQKTVEDNILSSIINFLN